MKAQLRPYQQQAVESIRGEFRDGRRAVLFVLPTGGGKTYTYAFIAESAGERGRRVLILEHRKELIRQASVSLATIGVRHAVVAPEPKVAGIRRAHVERVGWPLVDQRAHVAVASVQTLGRRMEWLEEFAPDLIIVDEAHHAVAGTWARIIQGCPSARLLGVTATPVRTDGQGLGDVFDAMVLGPSMRELIQLGALVPPRVIAPPSDLDLDQVAKRGGDYDAKALAAATDRPTITGSAVAHYEQHAGGGRAIVFCASIAHAEHVAQQFQERGHEFRVIHGGMDDGERDALIYGLADGRVRGLVSVDVISEGTDIPAAEVAILLRATQSEGLFLQQVGRVLRPAPGKSHGLVLDHVGNCGRFVGGEFRRNHGLPHDDRAWSLEGRKRRKRGEAEEPAVPIRQCPQCYAVHAPAPKCPECGHSYPVADRRPEYQDGALQEVAEGTVDPIVIERLEQRREQGRAQTVEAMVQQLGYSRGRAEHILAARAEKERLQHRLSSLLNEWQAIDGRNVYAVWGHTFGDVYRMKPKELRERVERVTEALVLSRAPAAAAG